MNAHKNARTTPYVRELMAVRRHEGWSIAEIAEAAGVSVRTVHKWLKGQSNLPNAVALAGRPEEGPFEPAALTPA